MIMPLYLHLSIHLCLAVISGYAIGRLTGRPTLGMIVGVIGGFFIDLDHVLEYFLVFGWQFNLQYFLQSRQFLSSEQIRLIFHAWEYLPLLLAAAVFFRRNLKLKTIFLGLAISGTVHLLSDVVINQYGFKYYSIIYRYQQHFSAVQLLSPAEYQRNQVFKERLGI